MRIPQKTKTKNYLYLTILAFIGLGFIFLAKWQIQRAYEKQALHEQLTQRLHLAPRELRPTQTIDPLQERFLPVLLHGQYLSQYNFLLDNQQHNKKVGYLLLTPFKLANSNQVILINRGWLARGLTRQDLPSIPTPTEHALMGYVNIPATGILMGPNIEHDSWPLVLQTIDFNLISSKLGIKIENYIVQLTPIDYIGIGSSKHWGYAVQWIALAITVLVYMGFLVVKWN
jgi:surfeit locus 1 family protein